MNFFGALTLVAALSSAVAEDAPGYRMIGIKIAVKDYRAAIDFYTKLGMIEGIKYNPAEQELKWPNPSQGSNIILVHDETGRFKLTPGTAWLMIQVPDVVATAKLLKDSGYADIGTPKDMKRYWILMIKDPDGNQIEMLGSPPK